MLYSYIVGSGSPTLYFTVLLTVIINELDSDNIARNNYCLENIVN